MNWYTRIKITQVQGEWWIDDSGSAMYADGNVGEYNHEMHVIESIVRKYIDFPEMIDYQGNDGIEYYVDQDWETVVDYMISSEGLITEEERKIAYQNPNGDSASYPGETYRELAVYNLVLADLLKMNGASDEEATIASGEGDIRLYAAKNWGWIRLQGSNLEMWSLDKGTMQRAAHGLYDAYGEEADKIVYNLFSYSTKRWFNNISFDMLDAGNVGGLRDNQFVGW